jgi:hypothetical protein
MGFPDPEAHERIRRRSLRTDCERRISLVDFVERKTGFPHIGVGMTAETVLVGLGVTDLAIHGGQMP